MKPKALVFQAHGSNRDFDVIEALTLAGADATGVPLNELRQNKTLLSDFCSFFLVAFPTLTH